MTDPVTVTITVVNRVPVGPVMVNYSVAHDTPLFVGLWDNTPAQLNTGTGRLPNSSSNDPLLNSIVNYVGSVSSPPVPPVSKTDPTLSSAGVVVLGQVENQTPPAQSGKAPAVLAGKVDNLLGSVSDADGDKIWVSQLTDPTHGTLNWNALGSFVYVPTPGYSGNDSFSYTVTDGLATTTIPVTISVTNQPPNASAETTTRCPATGC